MRTACCLLLALLLLAVQAYKVAIPRNLLMALAEESGFGGGDGEMAVIRKRSFDDVKRGGDRWMATVPRSGLMVGGRGWMPGFRSSNRWWEDSSF